MRRQVSSAALLVALLAAAIGASPTFAAFGLHDLALEFEAKDGSAVTRAGSHPFATNVDVAVNTVMEKLKINGVEQELEVPDEEARDVVTELPPGLLANPTAVPTCTTAEFAANEQTTNCPDASVLGTFNLVIGYGAPSSFNLPVYNLVPPPGKVIRLGFKPLALPVIVDGGIKPNPPYNGFAEALNIAQAAFFYRGTLTLWGDPASSDHDDERGSCSGTSLLCPVSVPKKPFFLLPRSCTGPLTTHVKARSWQHPESWLDYFFSTAGMTDCSKVPFVARIDSQLSTDNVESPAGLSFDLDIDDPAIGNPDGIAFSDMKKTVVTLPEGVTANPSLAEGLTGCTEADIARESAASQPGEGCPEASKIGSVEAESPLLEGKVLKGSLFIAQPYQNPFHTLLAFYMTVKSPERGVNIVVKGKVEPDLSTGQLVATFDDLPQAPVSHFRLRLREGGRSPLISPPSCGTYETKAVFTPWANPGTTFPATSSFKITRGVGGAPCPAAGARPFDPGFAAGSQNNTAGAYSPFSLRLTRRDGDQDLTRFDAVLPKGMAARLAGVGRCSDAQIALAKTKSGRAELSSPSCPSSSTIGTIEGGSGVGSQLTYVPGSLYLAGAFGGAPLSVVEIVPAVAGPFDVGTVVVRQALLVNPRTGEVTVDGAHSDPIPHILAGIPLRVRDIQVHVNRPSFTLNPTSCNPFATRASIWGGGQNPFSTHDDAPVSRSPHYQAASCASLGFKPSLDLRLKGGTKRGGHPRLRGTYKPRPGDANLEGLVLRLPRSVFLDQAHIKTVCTRVQFAADDCPTGAIYGHARAVTPLLSEPLKGPVYLRSSDHRLPDLVADLHGLVDIEAVARVDSKHGGIRVTFAGLPDAPITKAVVDMQGGRKGLVVNSTNLCAPRPHAHAVLDAQNGGRRTIDPIARADCRRR